MATKAKDLESKGEKKSKAGSSENKRKTLKERSAARKQRQEQQYQQTLAPIESRLSGMEMDTASVGTPAGGIAATAVSAGGGGGSSPFKFASQTDAPEKTQATETGCPGGVCPTGGKTTATVGGSTTSVPATGAVTEEQVLAAQSRLFPTTATAEPQLVSDDPTQVPGSVEPMVASTPEQVKQDLSIAIAPDEVIAGTDQPLTIGEKAQASGIRTDAQLRAGDEGLNTLKRGAAMLQAQIDQLDQQSFPDSMYGPAIKNKELKGVLLQRLDNKMTEIANYQKNLAEKRDPAYTNLVRQTTATLDSISQNETADAEMKDAVNPRSAGNDFINHVSASGEAVIKGDITMSYAHEVAAIAQMSGMLATVGPEILAAQAENAGGGTPMQKSDGTIQFNRNDLIDDVVGKVKTTFSMGRVQANWNSYTLGSQMEDSELGALRRERAVQGQATSVIYSILGTDDNGMITEAGRQMLNDAQLPALIANSPVMLDTESMIYNTARATGNMRTDVAEQYITAVRAAIPLQIQQMQSPNRDTFDRVFSTQTDRMMEAEPGVGQIPLGGKQ